MERFIGNPKDGKARASINGTWKLDISVNNNPKGSDLFVEKLTREEDEENEGNTDFGHAYSTVKINKKVKFIMDTGCGHDFISQRKARELDLNVHERPDGWVHLSQIIQLRHFSAGSFA